MKKEKALAASGNMITAPFNDAKAMGHTRGLIVEHGYIDWEGVFLAVEDSIRVFEPPTGTFKTKLAGSNTFLVAYGRPLSTSHSARSNQKSQVHAAFDSV